MIARPLYVHALNRAAAFLGGADKLATQLGVTEDLAWGWLQGKAHIPSYIFLKCVDVLANETMYQIGGKASAKPAPALAGPQRAGREEAASIQQPSV